jgi:ribose transport system substrate-binding protein
MHQYFRSAALLLVVTTLAAAGCSGGQSGQPTIAVIPKGTSHEFWQSVHAGARQAAAEFGVTIAWRGPLLEDDRNAQISEVENAIGRGARGIVLAPLDEIALVGPVESALRQNIPVVIFDSGLKSDRYVSFVATDNDVGGALAGAHMVKMLGGRGRVMLLRYAEGHDSTTRREEGFLKALREAPGIEIVSSNQYLGADVEGAYKRAEAVLSQYVNAEGQLNIDGLFCVNESTAFATLRVLQDNGWAGKVRYIGFDASGQLVEGLRAGLIDGLVVQDPVRMGYLSVKAMVAHLRGEPVEKRINSDVRLVTRADMDLPEVQQLLKPDLSKWLTP